jgi:hypothetical protein
MPVTLEGSIKRYIGLSTDAKPRPFFGGDENAAPLSGHMGEGETLPAGSSFLETDTGLIYRWDGVSAWAAVIPADETGQLLAAILVEITAIREMVELAVNS